MAQTTPSPVSIEIGQYTVDMARLAAKLARIANQSADALAMAEGDLVGHQDKMVMIRETILMANQAAAQPMVFLMASHQESVEAGQQRGMAFAKFDFGTG